jgi:hypothetical protein
MRAMKSTHSLTYRGRARWVALMLVVHTRCAALILPCTLAPPPRSLLTPQVVADWTGPYETTMNDLIRRISTKQLAAGLESALLPFDTLHIGGGAGGVYLPDPKFRLRVAIEHSNLYARGDNVMKQLWGREGGAEADQVCVLQNTTHPYSHTVPYCTILYSHTVPYSTLILYPHTVPPYCTPSRQRQWQQGWRER